MSGRLDGASSSASLSRSLSGASSVGVESVDTGDSLDSLSYGCQVTFLLNVLRAPTSSQLARKCKLCCNPATGVKRCKGGTTADPKRQESSLQDYVCLPVVLQYNKR